MNKYLEDLCIYDPRNPLSNANPEHGYPTDDDPEPRKNCSCDSCFYGKDRLALKILELEARLEDMDAVEFAAKDQERRFASTKRRVKELEALLDEYKDSEHRAVKSEGEALKALERVRSVERYTRVDWDDGFEDHPDGEVVKWVDLLEALEAERTT